jgi:hypothetical protein
VPILTAELERAQNWQAGLPDWSAAGVSLLPIDPEQGHVVIDAGGTLTFSQRVLPFATTITRFGTSRPGDASRFDQPELWLGTTPGTPGATPEPAVPVTESFSPAAFQELSDDDKLRSPAFERRPAGIRATTGTGLRGTYAKVRPARYDLIVCDSVDPADEIRTPAKDVAPGHQPSGELFTSLALGGAAGRSLAARDRRWRAEATQVPAGAPADLFVVVRTGDLRPLDAGGAAASPAAAGVLLQASDARRRLDDLAAREPGGAGALHVMPASQLPAGVGA